MHDIIQGVRGGKPAESPPRPAETPACNSWGQRLTDLPAACSMLMAGWSCTCNRVSRGSAARGGRGLRRGRSVRLRRGTCVELLRFTLSSSWPTGHVAGAQNPVCCHRWTLEVSLRPATAGHSLDQPLDTGTAAYVMLHGQVLACYTTTPWVHACLSW